MQDNISNVLVSIIVPIYNTPEVLLKKAIDSVLAQNYENFELMLIDDGSKDDYGAAIDSLAAHDSRIRIIYKVNGGVSCARNLRM